MKIVILAGGSGTRLRPISTNKMPKQFLTLENQLSLFQQTLKRFENSKIFDDFIIVSNKRYKKIIEKQLKDLNFKPKTHVLLENQKKNTAPATILSILYIKNVLKAKDQTKILVVPADHFISPKTKFLKTLENINTKKIKGILTFGIKPTKPEINYGYIKVKKKENDNIFKVDSFTEKPSLTKAEKYISLPEYYWNSGMFLFTIKTFLQELQTHQPRIFDLCKHDYDYFLTNYRLLKNISLDKALLEKTPNQYMVELKDIDWVDLGILDNFLKKFT